MVRVISVYNFTEQNIDTVPDDQNIVDVDIQSSDVIILAKANQIEIKTLSHQEKPTTSYSFPTVDNVQKIVYSKQGNYIGSLEYNDGGNSFVRIYVNWEGNVKNPPQISARIANLVTPNNARCGMMEMIELPIIFEQPHLFSICQSTGNILVATRKFLYLHQFKQYDDAKKKYIDFEECPFRIDLEFEPTFIAICENLIAACSVRSFLLIRVSDMICCGCAETGMSVDDSSMSSDDPSGKSDNFSDRRFDNQINLSENVDFSKISQQTYLNGELLRVPLQSTMVVPNNNDGGQLNTECQNAELQLTTVNNIKFKLQYRLPNGQYSIDNQNDGTTIFLYPILQLKLMPIQVEEKTHLPDVFTCLKLRPLYTNAFGDAQENVSNSYVPSTRFYMHSNFANKFRGVIFMLCTSSDGYLYEVNQHSHLSPLKMKCEINDSYNLTNYPFMSSNIQDVEITPTVLHVATDFGLESYSLPKLIINNESNVEHSSAMADSSGLCLVGLRPFPYLKKLLSEGNSLVLLTNATTVTDFPKDQVCIEPTNVDMLSETRNFLQKAISKSISAAISSNTLSRKTTIKSDISSSITSNWTIYSLTCPTISQLYEDFVELARKNYEKSQLVYAHLLMEAHSILCITKLYGILHVIKIDGKQTVELQNQWNPELEILYRQSCLALADYFIQNPSELKYQHAHGFYKKAQMNLQEIFCRNIKNESIPIGLIWTMKKSLIELIMRDDDSVIDILNRPVQLYGKTMRFGDAYFEVLAECSPHSISELYLNFEVLREHSSEKVYEILLRDSIVRSNENIMCIILHLIRKDDVITAFKLLEQLSIDDLRQIILKNWQLLFEPSLLQPNLYKISKVTSFSEITEICFLQHPKEIYQNLIVDVLLDIVLSYNHQYVDFVAVLKHFVDYMSGLAGSPEHSSTCQRMIQLFLEKYFSRLYNFNKSLTLKGIKTYSKFQPPYLTAKSETTTTTSSYLLGGTNDNILYAEANEFPSLEETSSIGDSEQNSREKDADNTKETNVHVAHNEGIKILIRIYLGQLRTYSIKQKNENKISKLQQQSEINFKNLEIDISQFILFAKSPTAGYEQISRLLSFENGCEIDDSPSILFLEERFDYLNLIPPFYKNIMNEHSGIERTSRLSIDDMSKEIKDFLKTVIKIQSLLCNKKLLSDEIRREVLHFLQTNNDVLIKDLVVALKVCIFNKPHALELLLNKCPQGMLPFAKKRFKLDSEWTQMIKMFKEKITSYPANDENYNNILTYQKFLRETLEYIAINKPLEVVLKIFPPDLTKTSDNETDVNLDDYIRLCSETESSGKITIMIENTGQQLWNLVKNKQN